MGKEGISALIVLPYKMSCQQKIHILVCYVNCKGNRGTKNNGKITKSKKEGKDWWGNIG